jgi:heptaprenyl diphosphate synthase
MIGVSMAGGVFHNIGQLVVAALVVETMQILYYFPVLLIAGMVTGILIGIIVTRVSRTIRIKL